MSKGVAEIEAFRNTNKMARALMKPNYQPLMPFSNTNWITVTKKNANINETRVITRPSSVPKSVIEAFRCRGTLNSILYILSYTIGQN